jgi:putative transcriptional regulator
MGGPTPAQIKAARKAAGLTQTQAASLIGKPLRTWQNWEGDPALPSSRKMDAALWELFLIKTKVG